MTLVDGPHRGLGVSTRWARWAASPAPAPVRPRRGRAARPAGAAGPRRCLFGGYRRRGAARNGSDNQPDGVDLGGGATANRRCHPVPRPGCTGSGWPGRPSRSAARRGRPLAAGPHGRHGFRARRSRPSAGRTASSRDRPRSAWCYGDPRGWPRRCCSRRANAGEPAWEAAATGLAVAGRCPPARPDGPSRTPGSAHGSAGLAHLFNRMYQMTAEPALADAARFWGGADC